MKIDGDWDFVRIIESRISESVLYTYFIEENSRECLQMKIIAF